METTTNEACFSVDLQFIMCFKVMQDISFIEIMPLFPAINKYGTEKRTHHYACISLLAERTHMCSVTPFPMGVWQKLLNVSHVLGNNSASRETHGDSPLKPQPQIIWSSSFNIWISASLFVLSFITFCYSSPFPTLPLIIFRKEARENQVSCYWCYPQRWEENQENNTIISHHLQRHRISGLHISLPA